MDYTDLTTAAPLPAETVCTVVTDTTTCTDPWLAYKMAFGDMLAFAIGFYLVYVAITRRFAH